MNINRNERLDAIEHELDTLLALLNVNDYNNTMVLWHNPYYRVEHSNYTSYVTTRGTAVTDHRFKLERMNELYCTQH